QDLTPIFYWLQVAISTASSLRYTTQVQVWRQGGGTILCDPINIVNTRHHDLCDQSIRASLRGGALFGADALSCPWPVHATLHFGGAKTRFASLHHAPRQLACAAWNRMVHRRRPCS